jgi:hypothetical protein
MRKLDEKQKVMIVKKAPTLAYNIIKYVEKLGNEKNNLEDDIQFAEDMIKEKR